MIHHSTNEEDKKKKKKKKKEKSCWEKSSFFPFHAQNTWEKKNEKTPKNSSLFLILDFQLWDSNLCMCVCVCVCVCVAFCWWLFVCCRLVVVWCWRKNKNPLDFLNFFGGGWLLFGDEDEQHSCLRDCWCLVLEMKNIWSLRDCWCLVLKMKNIDLWEIVVVVWCFGVCNLWNRIWTSLLEFFKLFFFVGFAVEESSIFEAIVAAAAAAAVVGCCWRIFNPWGSCYCYCCWVLKSRLRPTLRGLVVVVVVGLEIVICVQKKKKKNTS